MPKRPVAVLGATGTVGQRLVGLLLDHPFFELVAVGGSARRAGKPYGDLVRPGGGGLHREMLPHWLAQQEIKECVPGDAFPCSLVFSALPSEVASETEKEFARAGYAVVSNASAHRMEPDVPLLIPEVNHTHLNLIERQRRERSWRGCIVTNPNCSTITLALALAPLAQAFGLEAVQVITMQALSGAGLAGPSALEMLDNVVPYIRGEEEKLETEPRKLLGTLHEGEVVPFPVEISAQCNRVATLHGHLECIAVRLEKKVSLQEVTECWRSWRPLQKAGYNLPGAPEHPLIILSEPDRPQPRLDRDLENGMSSVVGRLRRDNILDYKFVVLGHNLDRGAAGGTLLIAELMHASGFLD